MIFTLKLLNMFINDEYINFKFDDRIADLIVSTNIFKNIAPNAITSLGICINIILFYLFSKNKFKGALVNTLLVIRFLCDICDGAVARKYNKSSDLGGFLDTIDDLLFIQIYIFVLLTKFLTSKLLVFIFILVTTFLNLYVMRNSIIDHSIIKDTTQEHKKDKLLAFTCNNSIFLFIGVIIFNNRFVQHIKPIF
jgi:phosphatidylglycerophosphate synthase